LGSWLRGDIEDRELASKRGFSERDKLLNRTDRNAPFAEIVEENGEGVEHILVIVEEEHRSGRADHVSHDQAPPFKPSTLIQV
jgi:hypothetical protein